MPGSIKIRAQMWMSESGDPLSQVLEDGSSSLCHGSGSNQSLATANECDTGLKSILAYIVCGTEK